MLLGSFLAYGFQCFTLALRSLWIRLVRAVCLGLLSGTISCLVGVVFEETRGFVVRLERAQGRVSTPEHLADFPASLTHPIGLAPVET